MSGNERSCGLSSDDYVETKNVLDPSKGCVTKFKGCYSKSNSIKIQNEQCTMSKQCIPITPFNMKEELEEGYFDCDGTYHWKEKRANTDDWLESINWNTNEKYKVHNCSSYESSDSEPDETVNEIYEKIVSYLKPKETVAKALCRLGKNTLSAAERWKLKKLGKTVNCNYRKSKKVTDLTGLANYILNKTGNVDIYQETYEKIVERISFFKKLNNEVTNPLSLFKNHTPEFDMFSDNFYK